MKNKILPLIFLLSFGYSFAQQNVSWADLSKVKFVEKYFPEHKGTFLSPQFSDEVKSLEGKKITIIGYYLDVDPNQKMFMLSKFPLASCFFCGGAGPETAVELDLKKNIKKFKTDDIVKVTGTLKLNDDDVKHFNYILQNCTIEAGN